jgi:hypothetical protein
MCGFDGESEQQSSANLGITGIRTDSVSMNFGNGFAMWQEAPTALEECRIGSGSTVAPTSAVAVPQREPARELS